MFFKKSIYWKRLNLQGEKLKSVLQEDCVYATENNLR
jgi:hypothetical protein